MAQAKRICLEPRENKSMIALSTENTFLANFFDVLDKNFRYAGCYRPKYQQSEHGTYPTPRSTLSSAPWYKIFTMEMRQFFKHFATEFVLWNFLLFQEWSKFPHFHIFVSFRSTGEIYSRVSSTTLDNFPDNFQTIYRHILENTEGPVKPESPP